MKNLKITFIFFGLFIFTIACDSPSSKADSWNEEQKTNWTNNCLKFMESREVDANQAIEFCDCMLTKTSEQYSPEEAAAITEDEERKLWESCDYQW